MVIRRLVVVGTALALTAACSGQPAPPGATSQAPGFPMTVESCGRPVTIQKQPQRVLTIGSTEATLVWAAGAANKIVARSGEEGAPLGPAAGALAGTPQVHPKEGIPLEEILGQTPDLVLGALRTTTPADLEAAGIPSISSPTTCGIGNSGPNLRGHVNFDDVFDGIELYGRVLGTRDAARQKVAELRRRVESVREQQRGAPAARTAAAVFGGTTLYVYGKRNMTHTQIEALGLTDTFADLDERVTELNAEQLITRNPDILIVLYTGGEGLATPEEAIAALRAQPGVAGISALRNNHVIAVQSPLALGSPLAVDGLETMARELRGFG